jgi:hypothetical protein
VADQLAGQRYADGRRRVHRCPRWAQAIAIPQAGGRRRHETSRVPVSVAPPDTEQTGDAVYTFEDTSVQAWANINTRTDVEYVASRSREVEFTFGGRRNGIILTFTEDAVEKLISTCQEALGELRAKCGQETAS